jgi:hypothetical protein
MCNAAHRCAAIAQVAVGLLSYLYNARFVYDDADALASAVLLLASYFAPNLLMLTSN